jgi:pimeloyl-ACP methyl ester carboxylesterase
MIIDFHAHYPKDAPDFPERLIELLPRAGIDRICLCSAGNPLGHESNEVVLQAAHRYPDQITALAYVELGVDGPECIERYAAAGFRGFKITNPRSSYDDEAYFPWPQSRTFMAEPRRGCSGFPVRGGPTLNPSASRL